MFDDDFNQIIEYVKSAVGKDIKNRNSNIDIEDLLTHIDIEIERSSSPKLTSVRQEMLTFIRRLLIQLSEKLSKSKRDYDNFVDSIEKSDTIVTFNWDILLDNCLGRESSIQSNGKSTRFDSMCHYLNFIQSLTVYAEGNLNDKTPQLPYAHWSADKGYYIKVHGSIDWFYCANETCSYYRKVIPVLDLKHNLYCPYCHEELSCMIIPPILNKGYRIYPLVRTLWNLASKEISTAEEIVIWGYSLPPTDFYAKWLLRQARQSSFKKLTLINPEVVSTSKGEATWGISFIRRFFDIYRDIVRKDTLFDSLFLYKDYNDYGSKVDIFESLSIPNKIEKYKNL